MLLSLIFTISIVNANVEQLRIDMNEYVDQTVIFNPLKSAAGTWYDSNENQSIYNLTGYITVTNENPEGSPMSDIYIFFDHTTNITLPTSYAGRTGTWRMSDPSSGGLMLHIPEILSGENSTWVYTINGSNIRPPLNFSTSYTDYKVLSGDNLTITDYAQNVFDNAAYQSDTCIQNINITQVSTPVSFAASTFEYTYFPSSVAGADSGNVSVAADNRSLTWDLWDGNCFYKGNTSNINYIVGSPLSVPKSDHYRMSNTTLQYQLNSTISHLRVIDIIAISEANVSFEKQIIAPAHPTLYGSNVTWNVSGYFGTSTSVNYTLHDVTFWVSQRNVNGSYTDPNTIDNDTISNATLNITYNPAFAVYNISQWSSPSWLFNYSDVPSPIVWMDVNFSITNDGVQLVNRTFTQNGNDLYIKELYIIIGYWLEIEKNITSIGGDDYHIKIDVWNKGNQVTPADSIVTVYDFVPGNFNLTSNFAYSSSPWYSTANASNDVVGVYNGSLVQWAIIPSNAVLNTSLASGPAKNENTTWSVEFNVTGQGDYTLLDVFITGLDPQKVDGAGGSRAVVVEEILDRIKSTEGIFAVVASVLLLLGLLL